MAKTGSVHRKQARARPDELDPLLVRGGGPGRHLIEPMFKSLGHLEQVAKYSRRPHYN